MNSNSEDGKLPTGKTSMPIPLKIYTRLISVIFYKFSMNKSKSNCFVNIKKQSLIHNDF